MPKPKQFPKFQLVPLPDSLIRVSTVRMPLNGRETEMPMSELIEDMNRTWLSYLSRSTTG